MTYREISAEQRKADLEQHQLWLESEHEKGVRLNWSGCNLRDANLLIIGPIGSRSAMLYVTFGDDIYCTTGCFRGTLAEFTKAVEATHDGRKHGKQYKAAITFIKAMAKLNAEVKE